MKSSKTNHIDLLTVNQLLTNSTGLGSGSTGSTGSGSGSTSSSSTGSTNRLARNLFSVILFSLLTIGFFINGCVKQMPEVNNPKVDNSEGSYNVGYSFDGSVASKVQPTNDHENRLNEAYLLFYEEGDGTEESEQYVTYQRVEINSSIKEFSLPIPKELVPDDKYKVVVVGNYDDNNEMDFRTFLINLVITDYTYTSHRRLFYSGMVGLRLSKNLPFYGTLQKIGLDEESLFTCPDPDRPAANLGVKVKFTRSVSRIDLENNVANKLVVTKVKVCNYRDRGYYYHSDAFLGDIVSGIDDADGEIDVLDPVDDRQIVYGGIYAYPNLVPNTSEGDEFTTCLIIEGYYQNQDLNAPENTDKLSYYRANISRYGDPQLLRGNTIYTITLNDVRGKGAPNVRDAMVSTDNILDYESDGDWGTGEKNISISDDGSYISVSTIEITFDSDADLRETINIKVKEGHKWTVGWEGVQDAHGFKFSVLDQKTLQVSTTIANDLVDVISTGKIRVQLSGIGYEDVYLVINLIQMPLSDELAMLTVGGHAGLADIDISGNGGEFRYPVITGTSRAIWKARKSNNSLDYATIITPTGANNGTFIINFSANLSLAERSGDVIFDREPKDNVSSVRFTFIQPVTDRAITVSSPQTSVNIEGFRKNKIDVKAYDGSTGGHDASSDGGGYIIHDFQGKKTVYIPYNITLANPEDYTWTATSSFNIKDAGLVSSVDYIADAKTAKAQAVTGDDGEGVYLFVDVTGPGDEKITGTLTIETVLKDVDNINTEVYKESFVLNITTSCGVGETTTASLVWDDRNIGGDVPFKEEGGVATFAGYFTNADKDLPGGHKYPRYKGDYYEWDEAIRTDGFVCPDGWRIPIKGEFDILVSTDLRFSKTRAFVVSDAKSNLFPYDYTGAWFPLAGWDGDSGDVNGYYWSSTESSSSNAYALYLGPTSGDTSGSSPKPSGFSVRCVKNVP